VPNTSIVKNAELGSESRLMSPGQAWPEDGVGEPDYKPLTADEAQQWRQRQLRAAPLKVVGLQLLAVVLLSVAVGVVSGLPGWMWSVSYGGLCVVVPALWFVLRQRRQAAFAERLGRDSNRLLRQFFVNEAIKVILTIAMLSMAPVVVLGLNWLVLLAGFVVVLKVYWLAVLFRPQLMGGKPR
jgi:ATP synthase protein I